MDVDELGALARTVGSNEFARRFPYLFLVFRETPKSERPMSFETEALSAEEWDLVMRGDLRVLPLVKTAGNPYSDRVSIGRARNCDIVLREPSVSKLHAHVRTEADGSFTIVDLDSQNGTLVNDVRAKPNQPMPLRSNDTITLGAVTALVLDATRVRTLLTDLSSRLP